MPDEALYVELGIGRCGIPAHINNTKLKARAFKKWAAKDNMEILRHEQEELEKEKKEGHSTTSLGVH